MCVLVYKCLHQAAPTYIVELEVEIRPFRACAMKICNKPLLMAESPKFPRNASGHNYWNSSVIVDLAMGQIPRSTKRISN